VLRWYVLGNVPGWGTLALILQVASTFCECTSGETTSSGIEEVASLVLSSTTIAHRPFRITLYVLLAAWHAGKRGTAGGGGRVCGSPGCGCHENESLRIMIRTFEAGVLTLRMDVDQKLTFGDPDIRES